MKMDHMGIKILLLKFNRIEKHQNMKKPDKENDNMTKKQGYKRPHVHLITFQEQTMEEMEER